MTLAWNLLFYIEDYMLKWGNTEVTVVKWGSTTCTAVYWGSTKVFPTNRGYDGSSYVAPIAGGLTWYDTTASSDTGSGSGTGATATSSSTSLNNSTGNRLTYRSTNMITTAQWASFQQVRITGRCYIYSDTGSSGSNAHAISSPSTSNASGGIAFYYSTNTTNLTSNNRWTLIVTGAQKVTVSNAVSGPTASISFVAYNTANHVTINDAYLGIRVYIIDNGASSGAYKHFQTIIDSIDFYSSIQYT